MKQTLTVENMSCQHCVARITDKLSQLPEVTDVAVDLDKGQVVVDTTKAYSQSDYQEVLTKTIYKVTSVA